MRSFLMLLAAAVLTTLGSQISAAAAPPPGSRTHTVLIEAVRFEPQTLTVKQGETSVWVNHDPFPHTVTAVGKQFDSHAIAAGSSWKFTARKAGVFAYACTLHPTMLGTLRVE